MLNKTKRLITLLLAVCMLVSMMPVVSGASISDFVDFPTGWSKPAMEAAVNNGLLSGVTHDEIRPQANLTRAEAATIIVRAFGANTRADVSAFTDMEPSAWYYDYIAKAVKMGVIRGKSATTMEPDTVITREEIFTILARVMVYTTNGTEALDKFADKAEVCEWGAPYVAVMVEKGYVNGDDLGNLEPKDYITREEFAQVMHNMFKTYITTPGTYSGTMEGIVVLRTGNVTLKDLTVNGDLVAADGANFEQINLTDSKINGRLLTRGGKFTLKNTTVSEGVVVNNVNGITAFNNYKTEDVFKGIIENTVATFLKKTTGGGVGGGYKPSTEKHTVTIYDTLGNVIKTIEDVKNNIKFGDIKSSFIVPDALWYQGDFLGWYDEDGNLIEDSMKITDDLHVYAKFSYKEYTVTLMNDGSVYDTLTFTYADAVPTLPVLANDASRIFRGWCTTAGDLSTKVDALALTEATAANYPMTLYAYWEPVEAGKHLVTFLGSDGSWIDTIQVTDGATFGTVKLAAPAAKWYENAFLGWYDADGNLIEDSKVITGEFVAQAKFSYKEFTVTLMNDGSIYDTLSFTYQDEVPTLPVLANDATRIFRGWCTTAGDLSTKVDVLTLTEATAASYPMTLYAYWEPVEADKHLVTFLGSDGSWIDTIQVADGTTFGTVKLAAPAAKWYENAFLGWYDTAGNLIEDTKAITGELVAQAKFSYKVYTVTLMKDGSVYDALTFTYFDGVPALPTLANEANRSFLGWSTVDGDATSIVDALVLNEATAASYPMTLYACWETVGVTQIAVTFLHSDGTTIDTIEVDPNATFGSIKLAAPAAKWYEDAFRGWLNEAGELVDDTFVITAPITVKASFSYKVFTVTLMKDGSIYDTLTFTYFDGVPSLPTLENESTRSFLGWSTVDGDVASIVDALVLNEATAANYPMTLYACWDLIEANTITVRYYYGYKGAEQKQMETTIEAGKSLADCSKTLPTLPTNMRHTGYKKDASVASLYAGANAFTHTIVPEFWYVNDEGALVRFADDIKLTKDTDVYLLYKNISIMGSINGEALAQLSADYYFDKTRTVDTVKDLLASGKASLTLAINNGKIPKYDETKQKLMDKLAATGAIDAEGNIKVFDVAFPLSKLVSKETVNGMVKTHIRRASETPEELDAILKLLDLEELAKHIQTTEPITVEFIKNYIDGLENADRIKFADEIYADVIALDAYKEVINRIFANNELLINEVDLAVIEVVSEAIKQLTYEEVIANMNNAAISKIDSILGDTFIKEHYDRAKDSYSAGLEAAIAKVASQAVAKTTYTTSLIFEIDMINEILLPLYDKAQVELVERLSSNPSLRYEENKYFKYLLEEQDVIAELFNYDAAKVSGDMTGYQIKDEMEYYTYLMNLLIIVDDALCWYGEEENIPAEALDALVEAAVGKFLIAHEKLNEILDAYYADGTLPPKVEILLNSVNQLNTLATRFESQISAMVGKYLGSNLNQKFETDDVLAKEKFQTAVDILLGMDDPVFTIDTLYDVFYRYDDKMQEKLNTLIESGKLDKAMDKFESTSFGSLLGTSGKRGKIADKLDEIKNSGKVQSAFDSIYDVLLVIAKEGIEPYRVDEDVITVEDAYEFTVQGITLKLTRQLV